MSCEATRDQLHELLQGRLAPAARAAAEAHLAGCAGCRRARDEEQLLDELLAERLPRHLAPMGLRVRLLELLEPTPRRRPRPAPLARVRRLLAPALAAGFAIALAAVLARSAHLSRDQLVAEAVNDHLRVIAAAHPLEIESGGPHQVKPWFEGRLDFAPEVPAEEGELRLRGGAVGYLFEERAAVLVYALRRHAVTLLAFRAGELPLPADGAPPRAAGERGFHVLLWRRGEVAYALVSDANAAELSALASRFAGP